MSIHIKSMRSFVALCVMFLSLTACSEDHIPLGEYRIEWDEHDPKLHGQVVHFNVPMSYVLLEKRHIGDYRKEEIYIGRILRSEDAVFMPGGDAKQGYLSQQVNEDSEFTIKASYWYRRDWFNRSLNGDRRYVVLLDENGVESLGSFLLFSLYSDRPELAEMRNDGKFE